MANKHRVYDREFKINAVQLYLKSGKTEKAITEELGIPKSTFAKWVINFKAEGDQGFPGKGYLKPENEEIFRLKRELSNAQQERDSLKKACAIFSQR